MPSHWSGTTLDPSYTHSIPARRLFRSGQLIHKCFPHSLLAPIVPVRLLPGHHPVAGLYSSPDSQSCEASCSPKLSTARLRRECPVSLRGCDNRFVLYNRGSSRVSKYKTLLPEQPEMPSSTPSSALPAVDQPGLTACGRPPWRGARCSPEPTTDDRMDGVEG
jgi:hypothetical protein